MTNSRTSFRGNDRDGEKVLVDNENIAKNQRSEARELRWHSRKWYEFIGEPIPSGGLKKKTVNVSKHGPSLLVSYFRVTRFNAFTVVNRCALRPSIIPKIIDPCQSQNQSNMILRNPLPGYSHILFYTWALEKGGQKTTNLNLSNPWENVCAIVVS